MFGDKPLQKRGFTVTISREQAEEHARIFWYVTHPGLLRKHHTEQVDYTPKEIQARDEFLKRWHDLTDEGVENGWVTDEPGEGYYPASLDYHTETVWDESEEEYVDRIAKWNEEHPDDRAP